MCVCVCVCVCFGSIFSLIHISLNIIDIFFRHIFLLILSYCRIDFMIFGGKWLMNLTKLFISQEHYIRWNYIYIYIYIYMCVCVCVCVCVCMSVCIYIHIYIYTCVRVFYLFNGISTSCGFTLTSIWIICKCLIVFITICVLFGLVWFIYSTAYHLFMGYLLPTLGFLENV